MDGSQSPTPTLDFPMTLEDAYKEIDVTDHDISDGDVVVAFHNIYSAKMTAHQFREIDNVRLLVATPPSSPQATGRLSRRFGFELGPSEKAFITIDDDNQASAAETANNQPSRANWPDPFSSSDDGIILTHDATSPYTYTSPSSNVSLLDSDCGEPIGGKYFNGNYWVCQECDEEFSEDELEDGKCPCAHIICFCDTEAFDPETDVCTCEPSSDDDGESTEDEPGMAWDSMNGVWRCTDCSWEVEADDENEGYCHWAEWVDSESDSEDEAFVEDDGPFNPEILTLMRTSEFQDSEVSADKHLEAVDWMQMSESQAFEISADKHLDAVEREPDIMDLTVDA
ncbi:MAG: hypothetical protein L6R37_000019 [Teloschistes peruensis]|nr:MAG: hypothetical protein L6R37_000019 [Teloschistes peruensis]